MESFISKIAAWIVVGAVCLVVGAVLGYRYCQGRAAASQVTQVTTYVDKVVDQSAADNTLAAKQAVKRTKARVIARAITTRGIADANLKAKPNCGLDSVSIGLLNDAIATANGEGAIDQRGMSERVRDVADAIERVGQVNSDVAVRGD